MYIFKANRQKGASIYAVRHCQKCFTTWNRDTNAARNIAFVFWYERKHGLGRRPLAFRRRSKPKAVAAETKSTTNEMGCSREDIPPNAT
jgi:hypothetical protein